MEILHVDLFWVYRYGLSDSYQIKTIPGKLDHVY